MHEHTPSPRPRFQPLAYAKRETQTRPLLLSSVKGGHQYLEHLFGPGAPASAAAGSSADTGQNHRIPARATYQPYGRTIQIACRSVWLRKTRLHTGTASADATRIANRARIAPSSARCARAISRTAVVTNAMPT